MRFFLFLLGLIFSSQCFSQTSEWKDVIVSEDMEIYVDTVSLGQKDNYHLVRVKTLYITENSRLEYIDNIRKAYGTTKADKLVKKLKKWNDFSYNISLREYDCANKRYRVLEVVDYTSNDVEIIKTKTGKKKLNWLNVEIETIGDYLLFYICDYGSI